MRGASGLSGAAQLGAPALATPMPEIPEAEEFIRGRCDGKGNKSGRGKGRTFAMNRSQIASPLGMRAPPRAATAEH